MVNEADVGHDEKVTSIHQAARGDTEPSLSPGSVDPENDAAASVSDKPASDKPASDNIALGLVMDIPVNVSLELGHTRLTIRELLELEPGALIPLDGSAAEEIQVLVNGKLVAFAEAVTVGDRCGVRLTRIVSGSTAASLLQSTA